MEDLISHVLRGRGVARASEFAAAGVTRGRLRGALGRGEVIRLAPRLFAAPAIDLSRDTDRRIAALAQGGADAVLSFWTAAAIWEMRRLKLGEAVHITVRRGVELHPLPGVVVHQSNQVDRWTRAGWPVTSPRSALIGLASDPDVNELRFPALAAVQRGLITPADVGDSAGVPRRSLGRWNQVAEEAAVGAESGGEGLYWRILHESRLPEPVLNRWIVAAGHRYRVDALWPDLGLGAEIDGREHHTRVADFDRDHSRQNHIQGEGIMLIRFTVRQVLEDPAEVLRQTAVNLATRARELGV